MGYLGLDQTEVKDDSMFQRLFWPSDHAGETDTLGKQGFWVCMVVGVVTVLQSAAQGHWLLGLLMLLFYVLGGIGVREHSTAAAVLVAATFLINVMAGIFFGALPGILPLGTIVLLLANIRGTWIAAKWASKAPDAMPERFAETFKDRFVDSMPAVVWPKARVPFFLLGALMLLLTVAGTVMLGVRGVPKSAPGQRLPSAELKVGPPR